MLATFRKFSNSIIAKVFLFIVVLPFIFWGMGPLFRGGDKNTIVKIGKDKISTQEFINYIKFNTPSEQTINENLIDKLLTEFIGNKLINKEIRNANIVLSESSLAKIIKNDKSFKKGNIFSRIEYEKFLVKNNLNAVSFEANVLNQEKKKQLLNLIGGGVVPSNFLVNINFDKINQKRFIEMIDLNEIFKKEIKFSEKKIELYFNENKEKYKNTYKSIKFIELNPKNLTENDEFNDLFFKKIDEIDDLIIEGKNLNFILQKHNLSSPASISFDENGKNEKSILVSNFSNKLIKIVFNIDETDPTILAEHKGKYFIIELTNTESIQKIISDPEVKKDIINHLKKHGKRKLISSLINDVNKKDFKKNDFDEFSQDKNLTIKKVELENLNDDKILESNLIKQIYERPKKSIIVITDIDFTHNYLVYIDEIENSFIKESSEDYEKYFNLSKAKIVSSLFSAYDTYLNTKYNIDINYSAVDVIKNNFR